MPSIAFLATEGLSPLWVCLRFELRMASHRRTDNCESQYGTDMHQVYLLRSLNDRTQHYVGYTDNVRERLAAHNAGRSPHTSKFRPWELRVVVSFADRDRAISFEQYLKTGSGHAFASRHFR